MRPHVWEKRQFCVPGCRTLELDVCARCGLPTVETSGVRIIAVPEADARGHARKIEAAPEDCDEVMVRQVQLA